MARQNETPFKNGNADLQNEKRDTATSVLLYKIGGHFSIHYMLHALPLDLFFAFFFKKRDRFIYSLVVNFLVFV